MVLACQSSQVYAFCKLYTVCDLIYIFTFHKSNTCEFLVSLVVVKGLGSGGGFNGEGASVVVGETKVSE